MTDPERFDFDSHYPPSMVQHEAGEYVLAEVYDAHVAKLSAALTQARGAAERWQGAYYALRLALGALLENDLKAHAALKAALAEAAP